LLGLGMALPWPLAGAGLAWLPKPGRWMVGVKYGFGVLIVGLALYYAHEAYAMFRHDHSVTRLVGAAVQGGGGEGEPARLAQALSQALKESKPVLIDFGASWCKNCLAMERTTFKEPSVQAALDRFVVLKFQAERPNTPEIKAVLDYYGVLGLPTYVVLTP